MEKELRQIYKKYKQHLLPLALAMAAFFILFRIALPQYSEITEVRQQIDKKEESIEMLQNSLSLIRSTPVTALDSNFNVATTALPPQKDVALMFTMLNGAASRANVQLQGFSLRVGSIFNTESDIDTDNTVDGIPYLSVTIQAEGSNSDLKRFAENLYTSIPLVELTRVSIDKGLGSYDVNFFFKPYITRPAAFINDVKNLTPAETKTLNELQGWTSQ